MSILCMALFFLAPQGSAVVQDVQIDRNEISIETSAGSRQITHDGSVKRLPTISPDGKRIAYVVDLGPVDGKETSDSGSHEDVVEVDLQGKALRHILPEGYIPRSFERLEWIDDERIGAMTCGHANCFYWILDADTGKTLKKMEGGFDFVWSHNRRWVARRFVDDTEPSKEMDALMLNDDWAYPSQGELANASRHGHILSEPAWSPDDRWIAFTDAQEPEGDNYVVLLSPGGVILRDTIAGDVSSNAEIKWLDGTRLVVNAVGHTLNLIVAGNELHDVTGNQ